MPERDHTNERPGPLDGVTVLDASRVLAGPFCGMQLGDLGADVIKVERPDGGDQTRHFRPPTFGDSGESSYYASINRNKRSLALNLATEEGRAVFYDLAMEADVLLENFRVGKMADWGLDYTTLSEENPGLVYCSITGYGQDGPMKDRPAYDVMMQAEGGMMSITGEEGRPPVRVGVAMADLASGMYAAQSILAALFRREFAGGDGDGNGDDDERAARDAGTARTGERIDVGLFDAIVAWSTYMATNTFASGAPPGRMGSRHPNIAPYQAYEAADGYVVVACASEAIWARFCEALDRPDLAADERFATNQDRVANRDELERIVADAFAEESVESMLGRLADHDVPAGKIYDLQEVFAQPQVEARNMLQRVPHPTAGEMQLPGCPMKFEGRSTEPRRHPPLLGEHTDELLAELGYDAERIRALREDDIVA